MVEDIDHREMSLPECLARMVNAVQWNWSKWVIWWHATLAVSVVVAIFIPLIAHWDGGDGLHRESSACTTAWEVIAVVLSVILTWFYYFSLYFDDQPTGVIVGIKNAGTLTLTLAFATVFLAVGLVFLFVTGSVLLLVSLVCATSCYFVYDLRCWSACRSAMKAAGANRDGTLLAERARTHRRSTLYANIPTLLGLATLLLYSCFHWISNGFQVGDMPVFIGGAAAMHVVYGDIVVGIIMATERAEV